MNSDADKELDPYRRLAPGMPLCQAVGGKPSGKSSTLAAPTRFAGMGGLVGVVLGAGSSRRLGQPKQTLAFGGQTLLSHVMGDIEAAQSLERIYLVLGGSSRKAESSLSLQRACLVRNDDYGTGCASSLLAGLDAAGDCDGIVMLLGDMPGVTAEVIDNLVEAWNEKPSWAAVTDYRGQLGHPFLFSASSFSDLRQLHGDKAIWKIVDSQPESRVARIPIDKPLPRDVDSWEDYEAVCKKFGFTAIDSSHRK